MLCPYATSMTQAGSDIILPGGVDDSGFEKTEEHMKNLRGLIPFIEDYYMRPEAQPLP